MKKIILLAVLLSLVMLFAGCAALTTPDTGTDPGTESAAPAGEEPGLLTDLTGGRSETVQIFLLITILSILPSILIMLTCFPRIIIVLSLIRNGLGLQNMPPNQVIIGLALFLTLMVMAPVIGEVKDVAYEPYVAGEVDEGQAIKLAMEPVRGYMLRQTYETDLEYFISASGSADEMEAVEDIPNTVLIPAYMTSEIKRGFQIGFFLYIPFVVIDMVVASVLMSMGMMMLPPTIISLPFKLLLFVLVDGWMLTVKTLLSSFG